MEYVISTTYNSKLVDSATWNFWKRFCGKETILSFILIPIAGYMWFGLKSRGWITATFLALSIVFFFVMVAIYFVYRYRSLKIFEQMESPQAEWRFNDNSFSVSSDIGKAEYKWKIIKKIWKFKSVWLLFYANQSYSTLPVDSMSAEIMEFVQQRVTQNGGKIT